MEVINVTAEADRFTANAYLVPGTTTTLIDIGTMPDVIEVIDRHVDTVDAVIITHQHGDHTGKLPSVVERYSPDVYAYDDHQLRTEAISDGDPVPVGDESATAVHTPGHAPDHVALYTDTALFSGDVCVYNNGAFDDGSFGKTDGPNMSREVLITSLERLISVLPPSVSELYAGHGNTYTGDVHTVIERALERARRREPKYPD